MGSLRPGGEDKDESPQTKKKRFCSSGTCIVQEKGDVSGQDDKERKTRQKEKQTDNSEAIHRHEKKGFKGKRTKLLRL